MVKFGSPSNTSDSNKMSTSAIRRMHFKCGRILSSKMSTNGTCTNSPISIPKVILMGSSTTSETTLINTSTDSTGTMTTNLTTTIEDSIEEPIDFVTNNNHMNVFDIDESDNQTAANINESSIINTNNNNGNDLMRFLMDSKQNLMNVIENFTQNHYQNNDDVNKNNKKRSPLLLSKRTNKKAAKNEKLPLLRINCLSDLFDRTPSTARTSTTSPSSPSSSPSSTQSATSSSSLQPINSTTHTINQSVHSSKSHSEDDSMAKHQYQHYHQQHLSSIYLQPNPKHLSVLHNGSGDPADQKITMKHLLEMTSHLTLEELHDFEMRYGSPHHNRSQSMKTPADARPNHLSLPQQRSRIASMPNTGVEEEYYRLRHFSTTGKGIINRGDSLKSRRYRSNTSVASSNSSNEQLQLNNSPAAGVQMFLDSARNSASCSLASSRESSQSIPPPTILPYRVIMFGDSAVGKSSLVSQFMTSEYLHAYDTSIDDDSGEKSISVLLDNEESDLVFVDHSTSDFHNDFDFLTEHFTKNFEDAHAYCIVYSISDRLSFNYAVQILQRIWGFEWMSSKALILVANKCDLVRSKAVSTEEGQAIATMYNCKYIETSVSINHNVDELLVGILTQIRLKLENPEKSRDIFLRKRSNSKKNLTRFLNRSPVKKMFEFQIETDPSTNYNRGNRLRNARLSASLRVKNFLGRVLYRESRSKSCENLHVL